MLSELIYITIAWQDKRNSYRKQFMLNIIRFRNVRVNEIWLHLQLFDISKLLSFILFKACKESIVQIYESNVGRLHIITLFLRGYILHFQFNILHMNKHFCHCVFRNEIKVLNPRSISIMKYFLLISYSSFISFA